MHANAVILYVSDLVNAERGENIKIYLWKMMKVADYSFLSNIWWSSLDRFFEPSKKWLRMCNFELVIKRIRYRIQYIQSPRTRKTGFCFHKYIVY